MQETARAILDTTTQKAHLWIEEVRGKLGRASGSSAYRALRSVLLVLRDQLDISAASRLGRKMPVLVRGMFYEDWNPDLRVPVRSREEFLALISERFGPDGQAGPEEMAHAVFDVLHTFLAEDFAEAMTTAPQPVQEFWNQETQHVEHRTESR